MQEFQHSLKSTSLTTPCAPLRCRRKAIEVVVGKFVNVDVVLGLLASIHHEPGGDAAPGTPLGVRSLS